MQFAVVVFYYREASDHLISVIESVLSPILDQIIALMEFMKEYPDYNVNADKFGSDTQARLDSDTRYNKAFFMRDSLRTKIRYLLKTAPAPAYKKELHAALAGAAARLDVECVYSAPGRFDFVLPFFLERAPWADMVEPVIISVLEGSAESALVTIHAMVESLVIELSGKIGRTTMLVVYCGFVRFIFDECYVRQSALFEPQARNAEFLMKCARFSQRTVQSLNVPERVRARYAPHMKVPTLFREKQAQALEKLVFLTNPIDLMKEAHDARQLITRYFGGGKPLEFKEVTVLMLALLSVSPPANSVSIALFLKRWGAMKFSEEIGKTAELFIAAVEYIFTHEALDDEEEDTAAAEGGDE
jgi:hypothetical protein